MTRLLDTTLLSAALIGLALAGCGGSSSPQKTSTTSPKPGGIVAAADRFAACMRDHGSPNFPDPVVSTSGNGGTVVAIRAPAGAVSPGRRKPMIPKPCRGILPSPQNVSPQQQAQQDATRRADLLSFAKCLRANGMKNFPDPTSQGQLTLQMITAAGVDLRAPQTLTAAKACIGASHGAVTGADVAQAIQQAPQ